MVGNDTQRARTDITICVAAAAARRSGTHGFGDGDACRSNGCAPPGPTKASTGIGVNPPSLSLFHQPKNEVSKKTGERGKHKRTLSFWAFRHPSVVRSMILRSRIWSCAYACMSLVNSARRELQRPYFYRKTVAKSELARWEETDDRRIRTYPEWNFMVQRFSRDISILDRLYRELLLD